MNGLLIGGRTVVVPGVSVLAPGALPWVRLDAGDYRARHTRWVRQTIIHTTKGIWPQYVRKSAGPPGADKVVADFWRNDPQHSAAQIVVDRDGSVACLADLALACAYHAGLSNDWSVGIEMYQEGDGGIYEAVLDSTVKVVKAICAAMSIPLQICVDPYRENTIVERMKNGGPDCVGIFGHRDQSWVFPFQVTKEKRARWPQGYAGRGRGDPGDEIYRLITERLDPEQFNYSASEDLETWGRRQRRLNDEFGEHLQLDGVCGPGTVAALRRHGFENGRGLDAA